MHSLSRAHTKTAARVITSLPTQVCRLHAVRPSLRHPFETGSYVFSTVPHLQFILLLGQIVQFYVAEVDILLLRQLSVLAVPGGDVDSRRQVRPSDGTRRAASVPQLPEELVDPVEGERPAEGSERALLLVNDNHGRVAEAADVDRGLQVRLSDGLRPEPAPLLLLEAVSEPLQVGEVGVPALGLAVEDVRQKRDHAQAVLLAGRLLHLVRRDLRGREQESVRHSSENGHKSAGHQSDT